MKIARVMAGMRYASCIGFFLFCGGCGADTAFDVQSGAAVASSCHSAIDRAGLRSYATLGRQRIKVGLEIEFYVDSLVKTREIVESVGGQPVRTLEVDGYQTTLDQRQFFQDPANPSALTAWSSYHYFPSTKRAVYSIQSPARSGFVDSNEEVVQTLTAAGIDYEKPDSFSVKVESFCRLDFWCGANALKSGPHQSSTIQFMLGSTSTSVASLAPESLIIPGDPPPGTLPPTPAAIKSPRDVYQIFDRWSAQHVVILGPPAEQDATLYRVAGLAGPLLVHYERSSYPPIGEISTSKGLLDTDHMIALQTLWNKLRESPHVYSRHPHSWKMQGLHINLDISPYVRNLPGTKAKVTNAIEDAGPLLAEWILLWSGYRKKLIEPLFQPDGDREFYAGPVPKNLLDQIYHRRTSVTTAELINLFDSLRGEIGVDFRLYKVPTDGRLELTLANADLNMPFSHLEDELEMAVAVLEQALENLDFN